MKVGKKGTNKKKLLYRSKTGPTRVLTLRKDFEEETDEIATVRRRIRREAWRGRT